MVKEEKSHTLTSIKYELEDFIEARTYSKPKNPEETKESRKLLENYNQYISKERLPTFISTYPPKNYTLVIPDKILKPLLIEVPKFIINVINPTEDIIYHTLINNRPHSSPFPWLHYIKQSTNKTRAVLKFIRNRNGIHNLNILNKLSLVGQLNDLKEDIIKTKRTLIDQGRFKELNILINAEEKELNILINEEELARQ